MQPSEEQLLEISKIYITEIQQSAKAFVESEAFSHYSYDDIVFNAMVSGFRLGLTKAAKYIEEAVVEALKDVTKDLRKEDKPMS